MTQPLTLTNALFSPINYTGPDGEHDAIAGIAAIYLHGATEKINKRWVKAAFLGNVGVVQFGDAVIAVSGRVDKGVQQQFVTAGIPILAQRVLQTEANTHFVAVGSMAADGVAHLAQPSAPPLLEQALSAEHHHPTPDGDPVTELLPTQEAYNRLNGTESAETTYHDGIKIALSSGYCPTYGAIDPYAMGWATLDEAVRGLIATGCNPDEIALLPTIAWPSVTTPASLGRLVRTLQGVHDAAVAYRTPIIAFQASNELSAENELIMTALAAQPANELPNRLQNEGNALYLVGTTSAEMGGTAYALLHGETGGIVPQPVTEGLARYRSMSRVMKQGYVAAAMPVGRGGLGVALARMADGSGFGAAIHLKSLVATVAHNDILLFSESIGRTLIEVPPEHEAALKMQLSAEPNARIGVVNRTDAITVTGYHGSVIIE